MKISSLIIGAVITLLIILPPLYLSRYSRKKKKIARKKFTSYCNSNGLQISNEDHFDQLWIGFDLNSGKIVFMKNPENPVLKGIIDLSEIVDVKLIKQMNKAKGSIEKLELIITMKQSDAFSIPIYNSQENDPLDAISFSENAKKWEKKLLGLISK